MPNWLYLLFNALYHLGLALWIGGGVVLGALAAPVLFAELPRVQAGAIFGKVLRRFSRLQLVALILVLIGAAGKYLMWETHAATPWLVVRWTSIAVLGVILLYGMVFMEKRMETLRRQMAPEATLDGAAREEFGRLHRRAEVLMKASMVAAVTTLFFS